MAHEALIREWPTLRSWLEQNRQDLYLHQNLSDAAQEWQSAARESDLLYRGLRLAQARVLGVNTPGRHEPSGARISGSIHRFERL